MSKRRLILLGAGGHGRVLLDALSSAGLRVDGILDPGMTPGESVCGTPVLGGDDLLAGLVPGEVFLVNGVGAGRRGAQRRQELFRHCQSLDLSFTTVVHASSVVSPAAGLGEGCQVMARAVVQCGAVVGRNVVINTAACVDHDCRIGDGVFIAPNVTLCGAVVVADGAFIGAGAVICPDIRIGANAVIGAGAVVISDVPDGATFVGNPAKLARS
jgi:sugar O-acyltransferase (sialic acid O-acetyltransferase NeuD family)